MDLAISFQDLSENFFRCTVCLDQFKNPKLLPCLHRYCRDCLETVIHASHDGKFNCPMCKQDYIITENEVDDFKTDFHMNSMLEFQKLQKSFETQDLQKCVSCSEDSQVFAYCWKCTDFLCDQCYKIHMSNKMFADHQTHTRKLENIDAKNLTLDKIPTLQVPNCHFHEEKEAILCCQTCRNLPVCFVCIYAMHKGHEVCDVTELANCEREMLALNLAEIDQHKSKIVELRKKVQAVSVKLSENVAKKTSKAKDQHKLETNMINGLLSKCTNEREKSLVEIETQRRDEMVEINTKLENELSQVRKKYDEIKKTANKKYDVEAKHVNEKSKEREGALSKKVGILDAEFKKITSTKDRIAQNNETELKNISDQRDQIIKRYEDFTATTSSILACKHEWTDAQYIPDIRTACKPLIEEMKKEYPELESLSDFIISDVPKVIVDDVTISDHAEYVVDIKRLKAQGLQVNDIVGMRDGKIVITGRNLNISHIAVIDRRGEILQQKNICYSSSGHGTTHCCYLSEFKVIAVFDDEIITWDVRDGSCKKKKMRDTISCWVLGMKAISVTTDPDNNHTFVGTNSKYVYELDDQLTYRHTITLPLFGHFWMKSAVTLSVHERNLLVLDHNGNKAYAVTTEGSNGNEIYAFKKPDRFLVTHQGKIQGNIWSPVDVCTDMNMFIYMLWNNTVKSVLTQYSQDGRKLLKTKSLDMICHLLTTLTEDGFISNGRHGGSYMRTLNREERHTVNTMIGWKVYALAMFCVMVSITVIQDL